MFAQILQTNFVNICGKIWGQIEKRVSDIHNLCLVVLAVLETYIVIWLSYKQ